MSSPSSRPRPTVSRPMCTRRLLGGALWLAPLLLLGAAPLSAQQGATEAGGTQQAAFLFAYRANAGMRSAFDEGYRRHLEWHRAKGDSFAWYGWDVVTGRDVGMFVDGTFGPSPAEFDHRIAPAEDAADFAATAAPFAEPLWRRVYRARPDLGTSRSLEERRPSPWLRVLSYQLRPGAAAPFEALLARLASTHASAAVPSRSWAAYELLDGGEGPAYLLLVPATGVSGVAAGGPTGWLETLASAEGLPAAEVLSNSVVRSTSALWLLRRDLTSIPARR